MPQLRVACGNVTCAPLVTLAGAVAGWLDGELAGHAERENLRAVSRAGPGGRARPCERGAPHDVRADLLVVGQIVDIHARDDPARV